LLLRVRAVSRVLLVTFFAVIHVAKAAPEHANARAAAQPPARRKVQDTEACTDGASPCFIAVGGVRSLAVEKTRRSSSP
jgi:hypothetical protein